jgi:hypothetical protein
MFHIKHHPVFAIPFLFSIASLALLSPEISLLSTITLEVFPETFAGMHTQIQMFKGNTSGPPNLETMVSDAQHLHIHEPPHSFVLGVPQNILQVWHGDNQLRFLLKFNIHHKVYQNKSKETNRQDQQVVNIDNVSAKLPFFERHVRFYR